MLLNGDQQQAVFKLLHGVRRPLEDLPYTDEFEQLYAQVAKIAERALTRHEFWEMLWRSAGSSDNVMNAVPSEAASAGTPTKQNYGDQGTGRVYSSSDQPSLFADPVEFQQPWDQPPAKQDTEEAQSKRDRLLADIAESRLGNMEQRIAYVLQHFSLRRAIATPRLLFDTGCSFRPRCWRNGIA
jgi:hypothetical protein